MYLVYWVLHRAGMYLVGDAVEDSVGVERGRVSKED